MIPAGLLHNNRELAQDSLKVIPARDGEAGTHLAGRLGRGHDDDLRGWISPARSKRTAVSRNASMASWSCRPSSCSLSCWSVMPAFVVCTCLTRWCRRAGGVPAASSTLLRLDCRQGAAAVLQVELPEHAKACAGRRPGCRPASAATIAASVRGTPSPSSARTSGVTRSMAAGLAEDQRLGTDMRVR